MRITLGIKLRRNIAKQQRRMSAAKLLPIGPVVAYGHPKTATRSVELALRSVPGAKVFHSHMLMAKHFTRKNNIFVPPTASGLCLEDQPMQWAVSDALKAGERITLVSTVRDPVAVNVSWFFFGLQRWFRSKRPINADLIPFEKLVSVFREDFPHQGILNWYTEEWAKVTGVDTGALGDIQKIGHQTVPFANGKACVLSAHLEDDQKAIVLDTLFGLTRGTVEVPKINLGLNRKNPEIYERLKIHIASDDEYLEKIYASAYAQNFFSHEQIESFRSSWKAIANRGSLS